MSGKSGSILPLNLYSSLKTHETSHYAEKFIRLKNSENDSWKTKLNCARKECRSCSNIFKSQNHHNHSSKELRYNILDLVRKPIGPINSEFLFELFYFLIKMKKRNFKKRPTDYNPIRFCIVTVQDRTKTSLAIAFRSLRTLPANLIKVD